MKWIPFSSIREEIKLPEEYTFEPLKKEEISTVMNLIREWYPDIQVGAESRHLDEEFYQNEVYFEEDGIDKPIFAITYKSQGKMIGFLSFEKNSASRTIMGALVIIVPEHRGYKLGAVPVYVIEAIAHKIGAELILHVATLKTPHQQFLGEKHGFKLVGIVPAYDRDMIAPGVIKRVFEAIYVKVLVSESEILMPEKESMTANTQQLFEFLFGNREEK